MSRRKTVKVAQLEGRADAFAAAREAVDSVGALLMEHALSAADDITKQTGAILAELAMKDGGFESFVHGAVESVATLRGAVRMDYDTSAVTQTVLNGRHGELNRAACDEVLASPWRVSGMWQWVLTDVIALPEPVPCKGAQGLWTLPADVESAVLAQLGGQHG